MNINDATECAYKNGYTQGIKDFLYAVIHDDSEYTAIAKQLLDKHNITTDL